MSREPRRLTKMIEFSLPIPSVHTYGPSIQARGPFRSVRCPALDKYDRDSAALFGVDLSGEEEDGEVDPLSEPLE